MDIFNELLYSAQGGSEQILYDGKVFYRYMDKLYIPSPPALLSQSNVVALSEMRLRFGHEVIDFNYSLDVVGTLLERLSPLKDAKLIDFGCGGGMICSYLKKFSSAYSISEIVGLDLSSFAVIEFMRNHHDLDINRLNAHLFDNDIKLNYPDNYFDGAISSFVMHFNIYKNQMSELYRVLKPGAFFVYNDYIYNKYKGHTKKVISLLIQVGFIIEEDNSISFKHPETNDIKNHRIIKVSKPI